MCDPGDMYNTFHRTYLYQQKTGNNPNVHSQKKGFKEKRAILHKMEYDIAMEVNYTLATCNNTDKSHKIILSRKSNSQMRYAMI